MTEFIFLELQPSLKSEAENIAMLGIHFIDTAFIQKFSENHLFSIRDWNLKTPMLMMTSPLFLTWVKTSKNPVGKAQYHLLNMNSVRLKTNLRRIREKNRLLKTKTTLRTLSSTNILSPKKEKTFLEDDYELNDILSIVEIIYCSHITKL